MSTIRLIRGRAVQWHDGEQWRTGRELMTPTCHIVGDDSEQTTLVESFGEIFFVSDDDLCDVPPRSSYEPDLMAKESQ